MTYQDSCTGLTAIVPVYNEERVVLETFKKLKSTLDSIKGLDYEIIFVNDGSRDSSAAKLKTIRDKRFRLVNHPYNKGYGASLKSGIRRAQFDWIMITDADGTYPFKPIPTMVALAGQYDMVVGERDKRGIPLIRRPAKLFLRKLASFVTGYPIPDLNSGLRIFRKEMAHEYWKLFPDGFSFTTTITMAALTSGRFVKYLPISYKKRIGSSSIRPIRDTIGFFALIFRMVMYFRPLRFFAVPAFLIFILFVISLIRDIVLRDITDSTTLLFVTAILVFMIGLVADLIVKRR